MGKIRLWTDLEDKFLKENYSKKGGGFCSIELNRTVVAVRRRANKIGLSVKHSNGRFNEENMLKAIAKSKNIRESLEEMGLRAAGGNYSVFHKKVKEYNIDTSHFESRDDVYKRTFAINSRNRKIPTSDILVENSSFNRTQLKKRLYDEGLKERFCEIPECGQGEEWMGNKMSLILDHKNGIHNDNRIENLRIVCPNCNATLPTHCGKNNKEKKERTKKSPILKTRKVKRPPFNQLQDEIKELGYSGTGRKYGVSDNSIRKWVKSYERYGE